MRTRRRNPNGHRQWFIVGLLSASIGINLVDRQVLSVAAPVLREQLSLSNTQYAYIILAFQLGMILGQVPAGFLMDVVGPRLGFALIFIGWSLVNALHGISRGLRTLLTLRFFLGLAECGNYSGGIKVVAQIFAPKDRGRAGGYFNGGAQLGAVIAPPLVVLITVKWGWRAAFFLPSVLGLVWLIPWLRFFPRRLENLRISAPVPEALQATNAPNLKRLIHQRQVVGLMIFRALTGPLTSFYWYWLPEYLRHGRGMAFVTIGLLAWTPYLAGCTGNLAGGYFSDSLIRRGATIDFARKLGFIAGAMLATLSLALPFIASAGVAVFVICLAVFGGQWMTANYISSVGDIFPASVVASVSGIGGLADSGMVMVTMLLTGIIVDHFSYLPVLLAAGIFPFLAVISIYVVVRRIAPVDPTSTLFTA
jgi:MFS transporter, ACS family, hexuronate transporter